MVVHITADDITLEDAQRLRETDPDWNGSPDPPGEGGGEIASGGLTTMPDQPPPF